MMSIWTQKGATLILAVHDIHRQELVAGMDMADLKELAQWVGQMRRPQG